MLITPNFHFTGQCADAMALYEKALGAQTKYLFHYSQTDPETLAQWKIPPADADRLVYHAEMDIGGQRIILSDALDGSVSKGHSLSLVVTFETADAVRRAYETLCEGGLLIYPMKTTSYSSCFVSLIDRFGMRWELMTEQTER